MADQKVTYLDHFGSDLMVANAARTSTDKWKEGELDANDAKLIWFLAKKIDENGLRPQHLSPFFHPKIQMRFEIPIFVARQLLRSTVGVDVSELSRRYVDSDPDVYEPDAWRYRAENAVKQGSGPVMPDELQGEAWQIYGAALDESILAYDALLSLPVSQEMARMVLPQSAFTTIVLTMSLAAAYRVYWLRSDPHAQKEIRDLAPMIDAIVSEHFPVSWAALKRADEELNSIIKLGLAAQAALKKQGQNEKQ